MSRLPEKDEAGWYDLDEYHNFWQNIVCKDDSELTQEEAEQKKMLLADVLRESTELIESKGMPTPKFDARWQQPYMVFPDGTIGKVFPIEESLILKVYAYDVEPQHLHAVCGDCESLIDPKTGEEWTLEEEEKFRVSPQAIEVEALPDMMLKVTFEKWIVKLYDVKPLLDEFEDFQELKDEAFFKDVRLSPRGYGISWGYDIDLAVEEIWLNGKSPS